MQQGHKGRGEAGKGAVKRRKRDGARTEPIVVYNSKLKLSIMATPCVVMAVATLSVRGAIGGGNVMMIVGLQMLVGSALLWPLSLGLETYEVTWSWRLVAAFVYTTLVPGLAEYGNTWIPAKPMLWQSR